MSKNSLYRISFINQDAVYEIYAKSVSESEMFSFLHVEEITFGEHTSIVVDPSEEKLKMEFSNVKSTYIPMHSIIRIDEVSKQGTAKVKEKVEIKNKITPFPVTDSSKKD